MPVAFWFWFLMLLWVLFRAWWERVPGQPYSWNWVPDHLLLFVLFCFLGWHNFGAPWNALVR